MPYYFLEGEALVSAAPLLFVLSLIALVPFADSLSFVTEELTSHTNPQAAGLINATFGNASELIFCYFALKDDLFRVVQLSLLGSILSNLLLVLGCACFVGGLKYRVQTFQRVSGAVSSGMLLVATAALALPAALKMAGQEDDEHDSLNFSRSASLVMVVMYILYLVFQLKTHAMEFTPSDDDATRDDDDNDGVVEMEVKEYDDDNDDDDDVEKANLLPKNLPAASQRSNPNSSTISSSSSHLTNHDNVLQQLSFNQCLLCLGFISLVVIALSDVLVGTIKSFSDANDSVNPVFVASVIIPIFGNAAEHAASVLFAYRNKMDICISIAVGSSIQISLLVTPMCVLMGWFIDKPMTLFFEGFETVALVMSVLIVCFFLSTGTSNWLIGALLMGLYLIIAEGFYYHDTEKRRWAMDVEDVTNNGNNGELKETMAEG
jgi:Ca2+:H+ antiporter